MYFLGLILCSSIVAIECVKILKWPNGVVPYEIDTAVESDKSQLQAIKDAINVFNTKTCIRWVKRTNENNYVRFWADYYSGSCYSHLGMIGEWQDISVGTTGCGTVSNILYEMMHTVGLVYERQRSNTLTKCDLEKLNKLYQCTKLVTNLNCPATPSTSVTPIEDRCEYLDTPGCRWTDKDNCNSQPGLYLTKCPMICGNCDGKSCFDTAGADYIKYCENTTLTCDDYMKRTSCPKTCGTCKV